MDEEAAERIPLRSGRGVPAHATMLVFWLLGGILLAFVLLPLIALSATQTVASLARIAQDVEVADALALSLAAAFVTAVIAGLFGVPLAYLLARGKFWGKGIVAAIVDLPLAVPHTVAGIALLMVFGRRGLIGGTADALFGLKFWGSFAGIVVAMLFVAAPFTVNAARIGFEAVDPRLEMVARTLGMGPWKTLLRVTLPLAWHGVATGLTLTYARSISEFGAVILLVYYPMTAPVKIYEMFLRFGLDDAAAAATLLLLVSLALFILFRALAFRRGIVAGSGR